MTAVTLARLLSARQFDVLALTAQGLTGWEIARKLGLSTSTVCVALTGARRSLGAATTPGAVAAAYRRGVFALEGRPRTRPLRLPRRRSQVWAGLADGLTPAEIADQLGVSLETVRTHASLLFAELGAIGPANAVDIGFRHRVELDLPDYDLWSVS